MRRLVGREGGSGAGKAHAFHRPHDGHQLRWRGRPAAALTGILGRPNGFLSRARLRDTRALNAARLRDTLALNAARLLAGRRALSILAGARPLLFR